MLSELRNNRYVYHYTSLETLFAILGNYRKKEDKEGLVFRASNIFRVNDPSEMKSGYGIVKNFLYYYEEEKKIPQELMLSEVYKNKIYEEKCINDYYSKISRNTIDIGAVPYVISFSCKRDYLPMWSMYGNQGKGICMKFDLYEIIDNRINDPIIGFVSYDVKSGFKSLYEIIPFYYDVCLKSWIRNEKKPTIEDKISELSTLCLSVTPFIKYKDYKYEKEFRMVYSKHYGGDLATFLDKKRLLLSFPVHEIVPYVEIPIYAHSLKEVILGPCIDAAILKNVIKRELESCELSVRISNSKVPFRIK